MCIICDMAKPPSEIKRTPYNLLLSDDERARYRAKAAEDQRDLANWIRMTLDAAAPAKRKGRR